MRFSKNSGRSFARMVGRGKSSSRLSLHGRRRKGGTSPWLPQLRGRHEVTYMAAFLRRSPQSRQNMIPQSLQEIQGGEALELRRKTCGDSAAGSLNKLPQATWASLRLARAMEGS